MLADRVRLLHWLFPLFFFQAYLGLSVVLFFFGPWPWPVQNPEALLVFLLASQLCFLLGYLAAALVPSPGSVVLDVTKLRRYFDLCLLVSLALSVPTSLARTGSALPDIFFGLSDPGQAYLDNYNRLLDGNAFVWAEYLRILLAVPITSTFPLLVYLWGSLGWGRRLLGAGVVIFHMCIYMATGTNKGIADVIITLPLLLVLASWAGGIRLQVFRPRYLLLFILAFALFLEFFSAGQVGRIGGVGQSGVLPAGQVVVQADRRNGEYAALLSPPLMVTYESLTRYMGQGYYAFASSMDLDSPSTFGFGHSMFLGRNMDSLLGTRYFTENSLPSVLEQRKGWSMMMLWHSLYTWLVSDFGLGGTLFLMGVFGFLLSLGWYRCLHRQGVIWLTMVYMMLILFYYTPANNQLFQIGETTSAFAMALLWLILSGERLFYQRGD